VTNRQEKRNLDGSVKGCLEICLFGPLHVRFEGQSLTLRSGKAASILALLLLRCGREVKREWLADMLWEDGASAGGLANLRQRLGDLRKALGPASGRLAAPSSRTLRFDAEENEVDLLQFDRLVERSDVESLTKAVALYTGPLLEDFIDFWAQGERDARQRKFLMALERLAADAIADGSPQAAAELLSRGATVDLFHQSLHRMLMEAYARQENWEAALQVYAELRRALLADHGVEPEQETIRLYQSLRSRARARRVAKTTELEHAETTYPIPVPLTALIGREAELRDIEARLLASRLVTLTGLGGVGKTRLALAAAHLLGETYAGGACFVDLSTTNEPEEIGSATAAALGLAGSGRMPGIERVRDHLHHRDMLLVLDNCEHLQAPCRGVAQQLLSECAHLRILATSRLPLQLIGESVVPVQPLKVGNDHSAEPGAMADSPAEQLFMARASAVRPDLERQSEHRASVQTICRLLDGLPLGLEIAAGLASVLSLQEIADFLPANRLPMDAASDAIPTRHGSLLTVLNASYSLLTLEERRLFRLLSVFAGGWTLDAAQYVAHSAPTLVDREGISHDQLPSVLPALRGLVAKSLVVAEESGGVSRYRLLEIVREYATERLRYEGDTGAACQRHQQFFADLAAHAEPRLTGPRQSLWLSRLQSESANLRAAILYGLEYPQANTSRSHLPTISLRTAVALGRFWHIRGRFAEGRDLLDRLHAATSVEGDTADRANGLGWAGLLAAYQGDYPAARVRAMEARAMWERLEDRSGLAGAIGVAALVEKDTGNLPLARELFEESLHAARRYGDPIAEASALGYLGIVAHSLGSLDEAEACYRASLVIRRRLEDTWGVAASLNNLALLARDRGNTATAGDLLRESITLRHTLEDQRSLAISLNILGKLYCDDGDTNRAQECYVESLRICRNLGDRRSIAYSLEHFADLFTKRQDWRRASDLYGAAAGLRSSIGAPLTPNAAADRAAKLGEIHSRLGADEVSRALDAHDGYALEELLNSLAV